MLPPWPAAPHPLQSPSMGWRLGTPLPTFTWFHEPIPQVSSWALFLGPGLGKLPGMNWPSIRRPSFLAFTRLSLLVQCPSLTSTPP